MSKNDDHGIAGWAINRHIERLPQETRDAYRDLAQSISSGQTQAFDACGNAVPLVDFFRSGYGQDPVYMGYVAALFLLAYKRGGGHWYTLSAGQGPLFDANRIGNTLSLENLPDGFHASVDMQQVHGADGTISWGKDHIACRMSGGTRQAHLEIGNCHLSQLALRLLEGPPHAVARWPYYSHTITLFVLAESYARQWHRNRIIIPYRAPKLDREKTASKS